jgi:hypothetical protein
MCAVDPPVGGARRTWEEIARLAIARQGSDQPAGRVGHQLSPPIGDPFATMRSVASATRSTAVSRSPLPWALWCFRSSSDFQHVADEAVSAPV